MTLKHLNNVSVCYLCRVTVQMSVACHCKRVVRHWPSPRLSNCCDLPWSHTGENTVQGMDPLNLNRFTLSMLVNVFLPPQCRALVLTSARCILKFYHVVSISIFIIHMSNHVPWISVLSSLQRLWVHCSIDATTPSTHLLTISSNSVYTDQIEFIMASISSWPALSWLSSVLHRPSFFLGQHASLPLLLLCEHSSLPITTCHVIMTTEGLGQTWISLALIPLTYNCLQHSQSYAIAT